MSSSSRLVKRDSGRRFEPVQWRTFAGLALPGPALPSPALQPAPEGKTVDAERIEKEAYQRGFREGEAAGLRQAQQQLHAAIQGFVQSASALASYKAGLHSQAEREMVQLSLAIARRILRRELSIDPDIVVAVVRSCLEQLQKADVYRLRLNPEDLPVVTAQWKQTRSVPLELIPDARLSRGGAVFETSQGQLDARWETQLGEIERGLADR